MLIHYTPFEHLAIRSVISGNVLTAQEWVNAVRLTCFKCVYVEY
jgi:hypothetical protein